MKLFTNYLIVQDQNLLKGLLPQPTYIEFSSQLGRSLRIFITENHDSFQLYHRLTRHTKRFGAEMFAQLVTEAWHPAGAQAVIGLHKVLQQNVA